MLSRARKSSTPLKSFADQKRSMRARIDRDYNNLKVVVCIENTNPFCFNKHCLNWQFNSLLVNCFNRHFSSLLLKQCLKCNCFVFKMKLLGSLNPYLNSLNTFKVLNNNCFISSILYYKKLKKPLDIGNKEGILC